MPTERLPLLASLVLQGFVAITFGVATFGLWRGFRRRPALRFSLAWLLLGCGVFWSLLVTAKGLGEGLPSALKGLMTLPVVFGVLLFRPAVDALVLPDSRVPPARHYWPAFAIAALTLTLPRPLLERVSPDLAATVFSFILPRVLMALGTWWAAVELWRIPRSEVRPGFRVAGVALTLMSARMLAAAGYEVWGLATAAAVGPESVLLSGLQVVLLLALGTGISVALTDAEGRRAQDDAETIRRTAEALSASERRFRFVVERSADLLVVVAPDGRLVYVAPTCEQLLGVTRESLEGRMLQEIAHPHDHGLATDLVEGDLSADQSVVSLRLSNNEGEWRDFEVSGAFSRPGPTGATADDRVLSLRDVTERRRLEAQVLHAQSLDSLGFMAGSMAHDFNNTLLAVQAGAELLSEDLEGAGGDLQEQARDILQAAERGGATVRQLLDFSRRRRAAPRVFDITERVRRLEALVTRAVGLAIDVTLDAPETRLFVSADPDQLDQVVLNLAMNARHAMPEGGVLALALAVDASSSGRQIRLEVRDTGVGIPSAQLSRVFEPFYTTRGDAGGTGLGLATARGFAQRSGGSLVVDSEEGVGTRFVLLLPRVVGGER